MPAIRYRDSMHGALLQQVMVGEKKYVPVRLKSGETMPLLWLGFICREGIKLFAAGAYAKMEAMEVTSGDGISVSDWVRLGQDKVALCWRVPYYTGATERWAVYGIDDVKKQPPKRPTAEIRFIDRVNPISIKHEKIKTK